MMLLQRDEGLMSVAPFAHSVSQVQKPTYVHPQGLGKKPCRPEVFLNQGSCSRMICCVSCTCTMRAPVEFSSPLAWRMQPGLTHTPHSADSIELVFFKGCRFNRGSIL